MKSLITKGLLSFLMFIAVSGKTSGQELSPGHQNLRALDSEGRWYYYFSPDATFFAKVYLYDQISNNRLITTSLSNLSPMGFEMVTNLSFSDLSAILSELEAQTTTVVREWSKQKQGYYMMSRSSADYGELLSTILGRSSTNDSCHKSFPFCTGTTYNYPAGVNSGTAQAGAYYGCLFTQPNPAWYHLKILNSGNIIITMQSNPARDIDFICWGPFTSPTTPCVAQLTQSKVVSCSYSTASIEVCTIPAAVTGQYYILLITNYSNQPCNIQFSQTGGTGSTDCTIVPPPIQNNGPLCVGQTLQLTVINPIPGSTYSWTGPNGWTSNQQNPSIPNVNLSHAGTYTLIITLNNIQSQPVSTQVVIVSPPNPVISGPANACQGSTQTYQVQNPTQGSTFQWTCTGGEITSGQGTASIQINWTASGLGNVRVTETPQVCPPVLSQPYNVTLNPLPAAPATPTGPTAPCSNGSSVYQTTGAVNANSYLWQLFPAEAGTINGMGLMANVVWNPAFTGTVQVRVKGQNLCGLGPWSQALDVVLQSVPAIPPAPNGPVKVCQGSSQVAYSTANVPSAMSYTWSLQPATAGNVFGSGTDVTVNWNPAYYGLATLSVCGVNLCGQGSYSPELTINVTPNPVANAGSNQSIPHGFSTTLQGSATGGTSPYAFSWSPPGLLVNPNVAQPQTLPLTQTTIFTLMVTDYDGCTSQSQVTITVTGGPLAVQAICNPTAVCPGSLSQLTAIPEGGSGNYTYSWTSIPPGFSSNLPNPYVNPMQTTTYTVQIFDGANYATAQTTVTVRPVPIADAGQDKTIAHGTNTFIHATASNSTPPYTYSWSPAHLLLSPQNALSQTVNLYETTTFSVVVTDAHGCISESDEITVYISGAALSANPSASHSTICYGSSTRLFANPSGGSGNYIYFSWTSDPSGFQSNEESPVVTPIVTTTYYVVVGDGFNTSPPATVVVTVNPLPILNLIPPGYNVIAPNTIISCVYDTVMISAGNPGSTYLWSNGDTSQVIAVKTSGIAYDQQSFNVLVTNEMGCSQTGYITIVFSFSACTGLNDDPQQPQYIIFPNPCRETVYLLTEDASQIQRLDLTDLHGVMRRSVLPVCPESPLRLDVSGLPPGVYLLRIVSLQHIVFTKLIVN